MKKRKVPRNSEYTILVQLYYGLQRNCQLDLTTESRRQILVLDGARISVFQTLDSLQRPFVRMIMITNDDENDASIMNTTLEHQNRCGLCNKTFRQSEYTQERHAPFCLCASNLQRLVPTYTPLEPVSIVVGFQPT